MSHLVPHASWPGPKAEINFLIDEFRLAAPKGDRRSDRMRLFCSNESVTLRYLGRCLDYEAT